MNDERLTAYLLGELPPEQELALEREYFADDDRFDQLLAADDELAYEYVQNRLTQDQRRRFESTIGSTERGRQNLQFARALLTVLKNHRESSGARYWLIGVAAAVILSVLPLYLARRVSVLTSDITQLRTDMARTSPATPIATAPPQIEAAFLLTPGRTRSNADQSHFQLSREATTIRFELVLPPGAGAGDYVISIARGAELYSAATTASARTAILRAPAALFTAGDYEATIRRFAAGEQPPVLATYPFQITK